MPACQVAQSPPHGPQPTRLLCPWGFPGKNIVMGYQFLLQGIFLAQGLNPSHPHLLQWQVDSLPLSHLGSPEFKMHRVPYMAIDPSVSVYVARTTCQAPPLDAHTTAWSHQTKTPALREPTNSKKAHNEQQTEQRCQSYSVRG